MKLRSLLLCTLAAASCSAERPSGEGQSAPAAGDRTLAPSRCSIGFRDLFLLAKGREWTPEEVQSFKALDQEGKNRMVKQLAAQAGCIRTEDQVGPDGVVYTAFWRE